MSNHNTCYFLTPEPGGEELIAIAQSMSGMGYNLSYSTKSIVCRLEAREILRDHGARSVLTWGPINEAVLPDNTPRDELLDTLRYQLGRCAAAETLLVIDPYLFPATPDPTYEADLVSLLEPSARAGLRIDIVTKSNRNTALEASVIASLKTMNAAVVVTCKYSNVFHDRFWIADGERGLFVGTSLNGLGRRYAVADYLWEQDARDVAQRHAALP